MKLLIIIILIINLTGCQVSGIKIMHEGQTTVEMQCKNFGDTQLNLDYADITITCFGGKISEQASNLITSLVDTVLGVIFPTSILNKAAKSVPEQVKEVIPEPELVKEKTILDIIKKNEPIFRWETTPSYSIDETDIATFEDLER